MRPADPRDREPAVAGALNREGVGQHRLHQDPQEESATRRRSSVHPSSIPAVTSDGTYAVAMISASRGVHGALVSTPALWRLSSLGTIIKTCILFAIVLLTSSSAFADPSVITGRAYVVDADTVDVAGVRVRLKGVDAAEMRTELGQFARQVMIEIISGSDLTCRLTGEKTHRREVGFCFTADGVDINREIIAQGAALAYPRYDARYLPFEQADAVASQPRAAYCLRRQ